MSQSADSRRGSPPAPPAGDPRKLDVFELARNAQVLSGSVGMQELPRMLTEIPEDAPERDQRFDWRVEGSMQAEFGSGGVLAGQPFLRLAVQGSAWLTCQRCLAPCPQPFDIDVLLRIAADEAEADAMPLDDDGPEVVVGSRQFDLLELVEEELLLALPLVPRHEVCPQVHEALSSGAAGVSESATDDDADTRADGERQNPFRGLAALRRDGGGNIQ